MVNVDAVERKLRRIAQGKEYAREDKIKQKTIVANQFWENIEARKKARREPRTFIKVYHEKSLFPISGKDAWKVELIKYPTMRRGSQVQKWSYFQTEREAELFSKLKRKKWTYNY